MYNECIFASQKGTKQRFSGAKEFSGYYVVLVVSEYAIVHLAFFCFRCFGFLLTDLLAVSYLSKNIILIPTAKSSTAKHFFTMCSGRLMAIFDEM